MEVYQGTGTKTAALYCRVSTAGQEDNYSLASQLLSCRTSDTDPTEAERGEIERALRDIEGAQKMQTLAIEALDDAELAAPNIARLKQLAKERQSLTSHLAELEQRKAGWAHGLEAGARLIEMFHVEMPHWNALPMTRSGRC